MAKIIGKGEFRSYSKDLVFTSPIRARDLPGLLKMPTELAELAIVVRGNQKLDFDELIHNDDEIYLFMAVMGG